MGYSWKEGREDEATDHIAAEVLNLRGGLGMGRSGRQKILPHLFPFTLDATGNLRDTCPLLCPGLLPLLFMPRPLQLLTLRVVLNSGPTGRVPYG